MNQLHKPTTSFWLVSIAALLWNIMGVIAYLMQAFSVKSEQLTTLPTEQPLLTETPAWVTAAFAIAVFGGTLGSLALLLRKKWARLVFLISLIGIISQMFYNFFISQEFANSNPSAIILPLLVLLIGVYLVIYSKLAIAKGWIA
ncbi:hypothetical protein ACFSQP_03635 [Bizionia sediminis]|uniref:Sugar transporter n=1 Tax=Bizionia sediminis TaxID=1737064 RepID=A0ABW5KPG2_9FLAO